MSFEEDWRQTYFQGLVEEEKKELANNADLITSFKQACADKGVILADCNFSYNIKIGIVASYPGLIDYFNSDILRDKEGLYDCNILFAIFKRKWFGPGVLYGGNYMLMADPYFRRGNNKDANFAPRFIELFWALRDPLIHSYISMDCDRFRINVDNSMYGEKDTWFGPKFNKDIRSIPDDIVKLRPPLDLASRHISFFFGDMYSLDIKWSTNEGIKNFYAEEFKTGDISIDINNTTYYPARYIHAEFDLDKGCFRHFDGAIHLYTETEYHLRRDADFNYNEKNNLQIKTLSKKLFKMNGCINIDTWMEFTSQFFTGDPLVFEYFEGSYPKHITEMLEILKKKSL